MLRHKTGSDVEQLFGRIGPGGLWFTFARSSGPGGQNVNKLNTRVTLWFDVENCAALTPQERTLIRARLGGRIAANGCLHVTSMRHRTQAANRKAAIERLLELLADALRPRAVRTPTRTPRRAKESRLREKRLASARKQLRSRRADDE